MAVALGLSAGAAYAEGGDHGKPHDKAHRGGGLMQKIDTNGDGNVSKAEFMAKHEEMFAKMDADSNGSLTKDEMKAAREKMKEKMKERRDGIRERREGKPDVQEPAAE